jgi:hypothetical protein
MGEGRRRRLIGSMPENVKRRSDMVKCEDCEFWVQKKKGDADGQCRRKPPVPVLIAKPNLITGEVETGVNSFFPKTRPEIECGEGEPKEEAIN